MLISAFYFMNLSSRPFLWDTPFNDWQFLSVAAFLTTINLQPPCTTDSSHNRSEV